MLVFVIVDLKEPAFGFVDFLNLFFNYINFCILFSSLSYSLMNMCENLQHTSKLDIKIIIQHVQMDLSQNPNLV